MAAAASAPKADGYVVRQGVETDCSQRHQHYTADVSLLPALDSSLVMSI
jgi:hypothetical protein